MWTKVNLASPGHRRSLRSGRLYRRPGKEEEHHERKIFKYGDNVDTDVIIPARYLNTGRQRAGLPLHGGHRQGLRQRERRRHHGGRRQLRLRLLPRARARWPSRPPASGASSPRALPASSTATPSTSACPSWSARKPRTPSSAGDPSSVDFDTGVITDETNGKTFQAEPFPPFIQDIIADGGLMKAR